MSAARNASSPPQYLAVSLNNFRGFKSALSVPLAPLTFLVGPNNAGKSSLFDSLLFISQTVGGSRSSHIPCWTGPLVDLGSFQDTVLNHDSSLHIRIAVQFPADLQHRYWLPSPSEEPVYPIRFSYYFRTNKRDPVGYLTRLNVTDMTSGAKIRVQRIAGATNPFVAEFMNFQRSGRGLEVLSTVADEIRKAIRRRSPQLRGRKSGWRRLRQFLQDTAYGSFIASTQRVASGRTGPKRWYSLAGLTYDELRYRSGPKVFDGVDPSIIDQAQTVSDKSLPRIYRRPSKQELTAILRKLGIAKRISSRRLSPYHSAISVRDPITGVKANLIDIGYGASQVIPVVLACLSRNRGPLFVEQPEIHLHPMAQATLAELLCKTSYRRQVVVETHSEHMINRARIMIAKGELPSRSVVVLFVSRSRSGSHVQPIPILDNGDFGAPWPIGFFDERYQDTMKLLELKERGSGE